MNLSFLKRAMLVFFLATFCFSISYAQGELNPAVESFEYEEVLKKYESSEWSKLSVSEDHFRFGKQSLKWEWNGEGFLGTSNFRILTHDESPLRYGHHFPASPTLIMSLYNEKAQDGKITISFWNNNEKKVWFDIDLSFTGWRRIWVPFYEMEGESPVKQTAIDYDYFKITTNAKSGKLFFDDIVFSQFQDDRHQYPDHVVPFIKKGQTAEKDHWMPMIQDYDRILKLKPAPISSEVISDLEKIQSSIDKDYVLADRYKLYIDKMREDFNKLGLKEQGNTVVGPPLVFRISQEYFDKNQQGDYRFNQLGDFGKVLSKLSKFMYRGTPVQTAEMEHMYLMCTKYFLDQGWQAGASGGTRHHIGYAVREIFESFFTARKLLRKEGLLNEVGGSLHWLYNLGMVLDDQENFHVNLDYLNTVAYYHLMSIFLFESKEMQASMLTAYSDYISIILSQQTQDYGFKIDGTSWHHNGHYPAYGIGAFNKVPKIISTLSLSPRFRVGVKGHENFKNAFLTTRLYCQKFDWGFGNSGRHPIEEMGISRLKGQFLAMINSGSPDGSSKIDKEVAAAYLRLWGDTDPLNTSLFKAYGIKKERISGYYPMPYAATAIHRRRNWAATIKGYSKYVWASEIYLDENRYGRYPANGTVQIMNTKGEKGSGFRQEGWDWNRYPGSTVIHLPFEELEPKMSLIMFRSNETFAGTVKMGANGAFGMILNEGKGSNADGKETKVGYPGKLRAKKSVFSYGNKLICIGTNISSIDEKNPTQTNIFQSYLEDKKTPILNSQVKIKKFPYRTELVSDHKKGKWLIDPYNNGYFVISDNAVQVKKEHQHSYHNKYSLRTGEMNKKGKGVKETEGDYASAWIDHGMAPSNGSYQYVIYPGLRSKEIENFGKKVNNDKSYKVLRADSIAHVVLDKKNTTTGYVVFEANQKLGAGVLSEVSSPSLVMLKEKGTDIYLNVVQPDLNFPEYKKGKYKNYSQPVLLTLTLDGEWKHFANSNIKFVSFLDNKTKVLVLCKDGLATKIRMRRQ